MNERKKIIMTLTLAVVFFSVGVQDVSAQACAGVCETPCTNGRQSTGMCAGGVQCCIAPVASAGGATPIAIPNPLQYDTVEDFVASVMAAVQDIVVVLAILAIVIGGVLYVISAGNSGLMTTAKGAITGALIGLAVVIAAPSFLKEVYTIVGGKDAPSQLQNALSLTQIAMKTLEFLLGIVGIIAVIMLLIGGIAYMTSGGDSKRADVGKEIVKNALIGIAIVMAALILVKQVVAFFA
ncbi:MAG: hypothetical protein WAU28_02265 [Candidatus Moraniibacteriota bacterium]